MATLTVYLSDFALVYDTLSGTDSPNPDYTYITMTDTITVSETLASDSIYQTGEALTVQDTIAFNITRQPGTLVQTVAVLQNVVAYIATHTDGNQGNIFVDPKIVAYENALTPPGNVTFTCNASSALPQAINTSVTLRKPDFGDEDKYEKFRIMRNTFGGNLEVFGDSIWPEYETLSMTWIYLSYEQASNLLAFLQITLGQLMTFANQFGETFNGYIITPNDKIVQPKVNGFSASLTFQINMNLTMSDPGLPGSGNTVVSGGNPETDND